MPETDWRKCTHHPGLKSEEADVLLGSEVKETGKSSLGHNTPVSRACRNQDQEINIKNSSRLLLSPVIETPVLSMQKAFDSWLKN